MPPVHRFALMLQNSFKAVFVAILESELFIEGYWIGTPTLNTIPIDSKHEFSREASLVRVCTYSISVYATTLVTPELLDFNW